MVVDSLRVMKQQFNYLIRRVSLKKNAVRRLRRTLTPHPPEINPSQVESSDSRDGTAEVRERLILAVTAILNPLVNPPPLQEQCVVTLHTLCKNVIDNPRDDRYRRVKATSRAMTQKVLACGGGEEFLNAAGWRKVALDYEGTYRCEDTVRRRGLLRVRRRRVYSTSSQESHPPT